MPLPDPHIALEALDELWFQVGGTLCNLACTHCFISCHPSNHSFGFLGLEDVRQRLEESRSLGVKEYYFTGGEPFLNRQIIPILEETLRHGPATVLTNGMAFGRSTVGELRRIAAASRYSLEVRVSMDGPDAARNDPIRGEGTFEGALEGVMLLARAGFLPIITMVQTWDDEETDGILARLSRILRERGCARPRIKIIPTLRIGMEAVRTRGYSPGERITAPMLEGYDRSRLLCSHSRIVTSRGVAVCPILIEAPGSHLGKTLAEAAAPFPVTHAPCYTCYLHGSICANPGASLPGSDR